MDFIKDTSLVLYLPLWKKDGNPIASEDAGGYLGTPTGVLRQFNGYYFDGADDQLNFGNKAQFNFTSRITIEVWAKPSTLTTLNNTTAFVGKVDNWYFGFQKTTGLLRRRIYNGAEVTATKGAMVANTFSHCCVAYDQYNGILYKDGEVVDSTAQTGAIATGANSLYIGTDTTGAGGFFFPGIIGEVRLYNRNLTPSEIIHNYLATKWRYK